MSEKLWKDIEIDFLNQICVNKGAIGVNDLQSILETAYGLKEYLFNKILDDVTEKEYCIVEKIKKLKGVEEDIVFITYKGLEGLSEKKKIDVKKVMKNQVAYELKCEGCTSYSEWLDSNRDRLMLEAEITSMLARALADIGIVIMAKGNENEINEVLEEAVARTKRRTEKLPELNNSVAYAIVMAMYDKMMELTGSDKLFREAEMAKKLIESYMPARFEASVEFI